MLVSGRQYNTEMREAVMDSDDSGINNSGKHYHAGYEEARQETMLNDL